MLRDKIYQTIKNNPLVSSSELIHKFGFERKTIFKATTKLLEDNLIVRGKTLKDCRIWIYRAVD